MKQCAAVKYTQREVFVIEQLCLESRGFLSVNGSALVIKSTSFVPRFGAKLTPRAWSEPQPALSMAACPRQGEL